MDFGNFNIHMWSVVMVTFIICAALIYFPVAKIKKNEAKVKINETT